MKKQKSSFMKLEQFKNKRNYKKIIAIILVVISIIGGVVIGTSFANFKENKTFKIMEGNFIYESQGDVILNFYEENKSVTELSGNFDFEKADCNNSATIAWNEKERKAIITNLTKTKTVCNVYYSKNQVKEFLENLLEEKPTELIYDGKETLGSDAGTTDNNLRFIGADPNNYVSFNNDENVWKGYYNESSEYYMVYNSYEECTGASSYNYNCTKIPAWRIIGLMNNVEDSEGNVGSYLKIVRESIGYYSWDSSIDENYGYGVNEWSEADIQKVLNENYYKKEAGGICYNGEKEQVTNCPKWEEIGLNEKARSMVSKIKWHTGTTPQTYDLENFSPNYMYEMEQSENDGRGCITYSNCNERIERTTSWIGYVGLMYPSDLGYSTKIKECITRDMENWRNNDCAKNSWLYGNSSWTMTPIKYYSDNYSVFKIEDSGEIWKEKASWGVGIRPVLYLRTNIKLSGNGTITSPFQVSMEGI